MHLGIVLETGFWQIRRSSVLKTCILVVVLKMWLDRTFDVVFRTLNRSTYFICYIFMKRV